MNQYAKDLAKTEKDKAIYELIFALGDIQEQLFEQLEFPVWRTFDGRVLAIAEMEDGHLINAFLYAFRNKSEEYKLRAMLAEIERRGLSIPEGKIKRGPNRGHTRYYDVARDEPRQEEGTNGADPQPTT